MQLSLGMMAQLGIALIANVIALAILPLTIGFTRWGMTATCIGFFILNLFMMSRLIKAGAPLSGLIPLMTGLIPLAMIAVGVLYFGENSSPLRIGLLLGACVLAASAAAVKV